MLDLGPPKIIFSDGGPNKIDPKNSFLRAVILIKTSDFKTALKITTPESSCKVPWNRACLFTFKIFLNFDTVTLSFIFDKHYLIID